VLNFGLEAQAIGRINRIGQTVQPVVERLVIADSIEQKVLQMSIRKQHLQSKAQVAESEQLKEKEVLELFGI
jgi:SNF2 family DNA or RNA helicase